MGKAHPSSHARSYIPNTMFLTDYPIASDYQTRSQNPQPIYLPTENVEWAQYMKTSSSFIEEQDDLRS